MFEDPSYFTSFKVSHVYLIYSFGQCPCHLNHLYEVVTSNAYLLTAVTVKK